MAVTMNYFKRSLLIVSVLLIFFNISGAAVNEKKIVVSSFTIESRESLGFLEKGIAHMLETRLKIPGQSFVVFSSEGGKGDAVTADYILEGTILIFGDSVNTDAKLINAASGKTELVFTRVGKTKGDVLTHIDLFAEQIRVEVLHLAPAHVVRGEAEKRYQPYVETQKPVIWRSRVLDMEIQSIAVSDIDNDSKNETLVLSKDRLSVFQGMGSHIKKISEINLASTDIRHLFVDVIDLDADGSKEIFITSMDDRTLKPASSLYKWGKSGLIKTADNIKWLLRAVDTKTRGRILLGQKIKGDGSSILGTGIFELKMDASGRLSPAASSFSFADTIFGLAFGDFMNNGTETIALLDLKGNLSLYSSEGTQIFTSAEEYGGSESYIEYKGMRYTKDDGYQMSKLYLQQRIFAADLHQDGKTHLIIIKNEDDAKGLLSKMRLYDKGYIQSLLWNEMGLGMQGRTQKVSGYISDYTIADMDNDGKKEIIFSTVNSKGLLKKKTSRIISQSFIAKGMN